MTDDKTGAKPPAPRQLMTLPIDWPGTPLPVMPGDFSQYVPQGLGLGAPLIVRPWDDPLRALSEPNYYGFDSPESDPIRAAPSNLSSGGVIYFHDRLREQDLRTVLTVMGLQNLRRDFVVFAADAKDTRRERFLTQARIMSKPALRHLFGAGVHMDQLTDQTLTMEEAIFTFLDEQRIQWKDSGRLAGTLGGDGDWAKEALAFGFLVENSYWAVYRVWSRPDLVTK